MILTIEIARESVSRIGQKKENFTKKFFTGVCKKIVEEKNLPKSRLKGVNEILMELVSTGELIYKNNFFYIKRKNKTYLSIIGDPFLFCVSDDEFNEIISTVGGKS